MHVKGVLKLFKALVAISYNKKMCSDAPGISLTKLKL